MTEAAKAKRDKEADTIDPTGGCQACYIDGFDAGYAEGDSEGINMESHLLDMKQREQKLIEALRNVCSKKNGLGHSLVKARATLAELGIKETP